MNNWEKAASALCERVVSLEDKINALNLELAEWKAKAEAYRLIIERAASWVAIQVAAVPSEKGKSIAASMRAALQPKEPTR